MLSAADTMLHSIRNHLNDMINNIINYLENKCTYLQDNSIVINANKSKFIIIGSKNVGSTYYDNLNTVIKSKCLEQVTQSNYFGVEIDKDLNMHSHVQNLVGKKSKIQGLFSR